MSLNSVSAVVLSWNSDAETKTCLEALLTISPHLLPEIIVIDNHSTDGSVLRLRSLTSTRLQVIYNDTNLGYAAANNQGYQLSHSEYVLLLNSDAVLTSETLQAMITFFDQHSDYAAVTTTLHNLDGSIQNYMHRRFPTAVRLLGALLHKRWPQFAPSFVRQYLYLDRTWSRDFDIEQAAGACLLIRRSVVTELGYLFDAEHFPLYYNDVDLCYRLWRAEKKIRCLTSVAVKHAKGTSVRKLSFGVNSYQYLYSSLWFFRKHHLWWSFWVLRITYGWLSLLRLNWQSWRTVWTLRYYDDRFR